MSLTKIGSIGINTGIQLAGVTTVAEFHVGAGSSVGIGTIAPDTPLHIRTSDTQKFILLVVELVEIIISDSKMLII